MIRLGRKPGGDVGYVEGAYQVILKVPGYALESIDVTAWITAANLRAFAQDVLATIPAPAPCQYPGCDGGHTTEQHDDYIARTDTLCEPV